MGSRFLWSSLFFHSGGDLVVYFPRVFHPRGVMPELRVRFFGFGATFGGGGVARRCVTSVNKSLRYVQRGGRFLRWVCSVGWMVYLDFVYPDFFGLCIDLTSVFVSGKYFGWGVVMRLSLANILVVRCLCVVS